MTSARWQVGGTALPIAPSTGATEVRPPRLYRASEHRVFGGVVAGLAAHLGIDSVRTRWILRIAFVVLAFSSGMGVVLYGAFWVVLPAAESPKPARPLWMQYVAGALGAIVAVAVVADTTSVNQFFVPITLAALGGALVWRQANENQRELWTRISTTSLTSTARGRIGVIRLVAGAAMVVAGAVIVLSRGSDLLQLGESLLVVLVVSAGFALITGPLWVRLVRDLSAERRELIRAQARADLAARVHDSVLQTLALIQRNSASPREVTRLARGQERELRTLLYGRRTATGLVAAALNDAAGEVEDSYGINVDVVVVGDAPMNRDLDALVQAAREALVNAAKHAEVGAVSVYSEVEAQQVVVFVRDRGRGFDPNGVPLDRHGLRGSITDRVERHGGHVQVRSSPGAGTEVELTMPSRAGHPHSDQPMAGQTTHPHRASGERP